MWWVPSHHHHLNHYWPKVKQTSIGLQTKYKMFNHRHYTIACQTCLAPQSFFHFLNLLEAVNLDVDLFTPIWNILTPLAKCYWETWHIWRGDQLMISKLGIKKKMYFHQIMDTIEVPLFPVEVVVAGRTEYVTDFDNTRCGKWQKIRWWWHFHFSLRVNLSGPKSCGILGIQCLSLSSSLQWRHNGRGSVSNH